MKNSRLILLAALLAVSSSVMAGNTLSYTNKTTMAPRPVGVNLPMQMSGFNHFMSMEKPEKSGAEHISVQATGFYQRSQKASKLAKYFLFNNKSSVTLVRGDVKNPVDSTVDLDLGFLLHESQAFVAGGPGAAVALIGTSGSIKLSPERSVYGLDLVYHYDLSKVFKNLSFMINAPVMDVQHRPNLLVSSSTADVKSQLQGYLQGSFSKIPVNGIDNYERLNKALMSTSRTVGIADIDAQLNYQCINHSWIKASLGAAITLPTGNRPRGTYLFESICGNGRHVAVGGQGFLDINVYEHGPLAIAAHLNAQYRYLCEGLEYRTMGMAGRNFSQYHLLFKAGAARASGTTIGTPLVPAANVLTLPTDITPGSRLDMTTSLEYSWRWLHGDIGYNLFYRQREGLKAPAVVDKSYGVAARRGVTNLGGTFPADPTTAAANFIDLASGLTAPQSTLSAATLDTSVARTPEQLTHGIFGSLNSIFNTHTHPLLMGLGGSYEWAHQNSSLDQWTLWIKTGITF